MGLSGTMAVLIGVSTFWDSVMVFIGRWGGGGGEVTSWKLLGSRIFEEHVSFCAVGDSFLWERVWLGGRRVVWVAGRFENDLLHP